MLDGGHFEFAADVQAVHHDTEEGGQIQHHTAALASYISER